MGNPLPRDPIADAQRNWERHGWGDVAAPMAAITAIITIERREHSPHCGGPDDPHHRA